MTDEPVVLREDRDGICLLTLNRPEKLNALNTGIFKQLNRHLDELEGQTDSVGCVVVRGNGRAFCAGADLVAMTPGAPGPSPNFKPGVIERLSELPQPVIAQVHGYCFTGGLELALAADIIVACESATFADTHGKWGLVGGWGMSQRLPRRIGVSQAKLMSFTGRTVDAAEALRIGLVDRVVADDQLAQTVAELTEMIVANSWHTNRETKRLMFDTSGMSIREGLAHEHYRYPGPAPDFRERIERFKERKS